MYGGGVSGEREDNNHNINNHNYLYDEGDYEGTSSVDRGQESER